MDPIRTYLGRLLLEEITPVVMVITTPLVEEACQKNGFSFVDMLLPFSLFPRIDVPVRTASDQPYRLQMFKLRLFYASNIRKQSYEAAEEHLKRIIYDLNEKNPPDLMSEPPQLETALAKSESDLCPAWIKTFNKELIRTVSFSEHETFDHPVACILVASSKDEEPINKFKGLFNMDQTPLLTEGAMDPKMLNHYVLLHDNQDGSAENASSILAEMKGTFGQYDCKMLCINSLREGDDNNSDVLWLPYRNYGILDNDKKCCLNTDDLNQIREFMQDLASNHIIPYMEQKIRVLNQQVSATRKGFRNQIKNLWWRKGKDDVPEATDGPMYTFSSIESQIRLLGDYAFMLRDYELALSNYRLLSTDYKLDKAWKRYAGVQEMCALSYFMLDQSRKDAEYCMENAFSTYLKVGSAQRNATRCGLWWAEMLKARSQFKDASSVYTRISNEEPTLHAAIMLEQASCCYLLSRPPMLRKYGFHLILAGNRYYMSDQKQHAIRAYRNALFVYRDYSWSYINDHVHFNIGRWYGSLGALDVAIKHVLEILACSHQSQSTQNLFLNEFFHFVQSAGKRFDVHKLRLPAINMSSYRVIHEDHRTYASAADFDMQESLWRDLEEDMIPTVSATRTNWLDSQPKSSLKKYDYCVCVAGEAVRVEIELKNPLQIPIPISGLSLMCEFSENSDASTLENGTASFSLDQSTGHTESPVNRLMDGDDSSFALAKFDLVLGAGETKRVKLKVTPKVEGILKIVGVRWTLSDSVVGYRYFEVDMKKKTKAKKAVKNSSGKNLILIVIKGVAKLEGRIDGLPEKASMGTLQLLNLKLRNTSESAIKNIKMKINHPRYLIPGSSQEIGLSFPHCLGKKDAHEEERSSLTDNKDTFKNLLFSFPESNVVHGGETFSWPIWFHCGTPGRVSLLISIYYEMENSSSGMTYRTLRMQHILEVLPSLDVSFVVSPCSSKLTEYLVRMDIINRSLLESFSFHQLSCVGNRWAISTLPSCTDITSVQTIVAGQALSCFFKIQDLNGGTEGECTGHGSDMLMGTEARRDALFDISKSPLINFHHQERHHQGKLDKRSESLMDFILISKAIGSNFELEAGSNHQLLSHHICHCSVTRKRSISWHMSGPPTIYHDFSSSFCEVDLHVDILNCSSNSLNVQLLTCDYTPDTTENPSSDLHGASDFSTKQSGWSDISLESDIKAMSSPKKVQKYHKPSSGSAPPFIWCGSCAIQLTLQPACTARVPLKVCVFAPGTYNLSNFELHWKDEAEGHSDTGTGQGHPFYLTVLEEPPSKVTTV